MNVRKLVICPKAGECAKPGFCSHRIQHLENGQCYPDKADALYADPNCPYCVEVK